MASYSNYCNNNSIVSWNINYTYWRYARVPTTSICTCVFLRHRVSLFRGPQLVSNLFLVNKLLKTIVFKIKYKSSFIKYDKLWLKQKKSQEFRGPLNSIRTEWPYTYYKRRHSIYIYVDAPARPSKRAAYPGLGGYELHFPS